MKLASKLITQFGRFVLFASISFLGLLVFFNHFGFAQEFANYLLIFLLLVISFSLFYNRYDSTIEGRSSFSRKFLFLGWFVILLTAFLVFKSIFTAGPAVWGDAPYYYPEIFGDFFPEPLVWEARGRLGVVNDLYWIYPLMFLYSILGNLGLSNDLVIRLIFYIPAIFSALLSPWLLARYLRLSWLVSLFSVLVYSLSTYFILVIDGGQVGVALAYGLFPLALLQLLKLKDNKTLSQFYLTLSVFILLVMADVRFAAIAIFTYFLQLTLNYITSQEKITYTFWKIFTVFTFVVLVLSSYWLVPALILEPTTGSGIRSDSQLISVLNPLFLYSPHWPLNEFGKVSPPPWYFFGIPLLVFANIFFKTTRKEYAFIFNFLLFVFLAKGETGLLGGFYAWFVDTIPFGGAFRDSTKFFAPLLLFAGILIGLAVQNLQQILKKQVLSKFVFILSFTYLLFLIHPAILQNMNGVLHGRDFPNDINIIANKISKENVFLRTVWFPERHPLGFHTEKKPLLDAKSLVNLRPFASINTGTLDVYNFLHDENYFEWFKLFGVKYLVFSGDTRKVILNSEEQEDWSNLLNLVDSKKELGKLNWNIDIPVYKIEESKPRIYGVNKVLVVLGADDIYVKLKAVSPEFSIGNQGFIFLEDGKTDPQGFEQITSDSAVLVLNKKSDKDLAMTYLQEYFLSPRESRQSEWAIRNGSEYLKWKYDLLVNNIPTREFDYGKGIAFSSKAGEKITFRIETPISGEYTLAIRSMSHSRSEFLNGSIDTKDFQVSYLSPGEFQWYINDDVDMIAGEHELVLENKSGFHVVNTVALVPREQWLDVWEKTKELKGKMEVLNIESADEFDRLERILLENLWQTIDYKQKSPIEYELVVPDKTKWIVFTDAYHDNWVLKGPRQEKSYPFYSAVNGFFTPESGNYKIVFTGQETARAGLYLSILSFILLVFIYFVYILNKKLDREKK